MASRPKPAAAASAAAPKLDADGSAEAVSAAADREIGLDAEQAGIETEATGGGGSSPLNGQIAAAVANLDALVTGMGPAQSMAMLDAVMVQSLGLAMQGAIARQQADRVISAAVVSAACARMLEIAGLPTPAPPPASASPPIQPAVAAREPSRAAPRKAASGAPRTRKTA